MGDTEFKEALFEFDMNILQAEQMIVQEEILNRYNKNFLLLNESVIENVSNVISKIFTSIAEFLAKAIMNAKKTFMNVNFSSAKKVMENVRKSTNEPKDISFTLKIPTLNFVESNILNDLSKENVGFKISNSTFVVDGSNDFVKGIKDSLSAESNSSNKKYTKNYARKYVLNLLGVNAENAENIDDIVKNTDDTEINKSNCRNMTGNVEKQLENVSNYMNSGFKKIIDKLSKLQADSFKFSIYAKNHKCGKMIIGSEKMSAKEMTKLLRLTAVYYSTAVKFVTQYIFKLTSFHITCLKENIMNMKKALL